ncbi:hypothetical protein A245_42025, partial [Pseudomonas syringae pv. actinidiae ICMP 19096]
MGEEQHVGRTARTVADTYQPVAADGAFDNRHRPAARRRLDTGLRFPEHARIDGLGIRFDRQTGEQRVSHRGQLQVPDVPHRNASGSLGQKCLGLSERLDRKLPRQITQIPRRVIKQPFKTGLPGALRCSQADRKHVVLQIQPGRLDRGDECLGDWVFGIKAGK